MNAKPSSRISITAVAVMLMATCHDDPVTLNEPERPTLLDLFALPLPHRLAHRSDARRSAATSVLR